MADEPIHPESESTKRCGRCKCVLPRSAFGTRPNGKPKGYCRPCDREYKTAWYARNRQQITEKFRAWRKANPDIKAARDRSYRERNRERCLERARQWVARNKEKRREIWQRWYANNRAKADAATKKWIREHPHHVSERSRRLKAIRKQCYVKWASRDAMAALYAEASRLTRETGIPHEVDHIVPLASRIVCGLHWEGNMRVVPRSVNRSKNNKLIEELAV